MLQLYYSALIAVAAFLVLSLIILPLLTSALVYAAYFVISLFRRIQNRSLYW